METTEQVFLQFDLTKTFAGSKSSAGWIKQDVTIYVASFEFALDAAENCLT